MIPLFEQYPFLKDTIPYKSLGNFPTPVEKLNKLGKSLGLKNLYIKRDDLSGKIYGGNKVRKLEFLLGNALSLKKDVVLTFGYAGSNHALATAIYAKEVGLKSISMLMTQPNAQYVRKNILMSYSVGAELHQYRNSKFLFLGSIYKLMRYKRKHGDFPYIIPPGGSSPVGVLGFVNAAFELKKQVMQGYIPEPDYIYVAFGTMGTAVGLMLGLYAANLKTKVICIRVVDKKFANKKKQIRLFNKSNNLLHSNDTSFPKLAISNKDIDIRHDFFGEQYALYTKEGVNALIRMKDEEDIDLEGTYTGKTLAALIEDATNLNLAEKVILFWNTYNSIDLLDNIKDIDYHKLPKSFHSYFESDTQPLDKI